MQSFLSQNRGFTVFTNLNLLSNLNSEYDSNKCVPARKRAVREAGEALIPSAKKGGRFETDLELNESLCRGGGYSISHSSRLPGMVGTIGMPGCFKPRIHQRIDD